MIRFAIFTLVLLSHSVVWSQTVVVDFDSLSGYTDFSASGNHLNGYGFGASSGTWSSEGVTFNTNEFGPGFSYSNSSDNTTTGFGNQFSAITGAGIGGAGNYALGTIGFGLEVPVINLPTDFRPESMFITNSTYAALSMQNGDSFAKQFGGPSGDDPDFLRITFSGYSGLGASGAVTGTQEFFLADYRFVDNNMDFIVDQWTMLDLETLGNARSISFAFDGTDNDPMFGLNTPAYFAFDNLAITAVPEPSSVLALASLAGIAALSQRRRKRLKETHAAA